MANTLLSDIINDAYRESNLTNINSTLTTLQQSEGLRLLLRLIASVYGNEIGENFESFPIGRVNVVSPGGYPPPFPDSRYMPLNIRVPLNLDAARTILLHPNPQDGSRFAVVDENSTVLNVTVNANGRRIEGNPTYNFTTVHSYREWMYDAQTGIWNVVTPLSPTDPMPFPVEFDDYFVIGLAMRLNPRYTQATQTESVERFKDVSRKLKARYHQTIEKPSELGLIMTPNKRPQWGYYYGYGYGDSQAIFNAGYPFFY